jgi:hypothetical protein
MKIYRSDKLIAYLTLLSGLTISAVAVYYSVAGLVSIFAAAAIPIIIMGVALELSKLVATVWLKQNWTRAPRGLKWYLSSAVVVLMIITSMGIFGFLSKAHLDQSVPTGDVADKVALIDEKIATERENVNAARKALAQMDASVNETLSRSTSEQGADKAVAIRRTQAKERKVLQDEISQAQKRIAVLNEERAPIAKELRKVEAEVGPIKYIAKLIYGDNPDANLLEKAVTWVIMIIVFVFDPLAVMLLLASQHSFAWFRKEEEEQTKDDSLEVPANVVEGQPTVTKSDEEFNFTEDDYDEMNVPIEEPKVSSDPTPPGWMFVNHAMEGFNEQKPLTDWSEDEPTEQEENEILDSVSHSEKAEMQAWKHDNPNKSLKIQKRLFEKGKIDRLPWEGYLDKNISDEEAAKEAARWAAEQLERPGDYLPENENKISWMENQEGLQIKKTKDGYTQNAEQSERTIWQRIQDSKK